MRFSALLAAISAFVCVQSASAQTAAPPPPPPAPTTTVAALLAKGYEVKSVDFLAVDQADAFYTAESSTPQHRSLVIVTFQLRSALAVCTVFTTAWTNQNAGVDAPGQCFEHK